jgi:hypothetical protein
MSSNYGSNQSFLFDELTQTKITATATAAELFTGGSRNPRRQVIRVYNDGNRSVFIGPSGVTASGPTKGEELRKQEAISMSLGDTGLFAITSSGTCDLIVTELS